MSDVNKKFFENFTAVPLKDQSLPNHYDAGEVIHLGLNYSGTRMAYSRTDGSVRVWSMLNDGGRDPVVMEAPHARPVELLCFHTQEEFVFATVARDEFIRIWRTNGSLQREIRVKTPLSRSSSEKSRGGVVLQHVSYSSDGVVVMAADRDGWVYGFDALFAPVFAFDVGEYVYSTMWFHFEHKYFACGLQDGTIPVFELSDNDSESQERYGVRKLATLRGHRSSVTCLAIDPRGKYFAAGSVEGVVLIWNTESMLVTRVISDVDEAVSGLDISRDGTYVAVTFDKSANGKIYDTALGEVILEIPSSQSGPQVTAQIVWFPQKTTFVYVADKGRNVVLMKRPEEGTRKRTDEKARDNRDRDNRDRENRDNRESRDNRDNRDTRDNRDRDRDNRKRKVQHHHRY